MTSPRVLMVRNSEGSGPGRLLPWLRDEGLDVVELAGAEAPADPAGYDGVVLLGGGFLPDDDAYAPWLPGQRELTRRAVAEGVPLLGICLGAQVLAAAEGGTVEGSYGVPERGSCAVELREEAGGDGLLEGLPRRFRAIQNHRDQITCLPPGSAHLARSEACQVQAFRVGGCAWGVQFHPEAGADRLDGWDEAALADKGLDLAALRAEARAAEPASARAARRLAANFATVVRAHA
ncbi:MULTISPECIES: type 1 glutamine amidotransferase [unclassified Streptomyces]|uniref:type 1 glutamine amidotransferase n=1 Tax=unclassified Streptomyces TaxID=2593676 RepID=UPI00336A6D77